MKSKQAIGLIGAGLFIFLAFQGLSSFVSHSIREMLLFTELRPVLIFITSEYLALIVILITFFFVISRIRKNDFYNENTIKRIFIYSVVAFVLTQFLVFLQPIIAYSYESNKYFNLIEEYYHVIGENKTLLTFSVKLPTVIIKYLVIGFVVMKNIKKATV